MSENKKTSRKYRRNKNGSGKPQATAGGKEVEVNVKDSDINASDITPMERRDKRKRNRGNDQRWYTHYPRLVADAAGINFSLPNGAPIDWHDRNQSVWKHYIETEPGICNIHFIPTIGSAEQNIESVANKISAQIYTVQRQKLGSAASYDATDDMLYFTAMDSAFLIYCFAVKIYGCMRMASPFNYYYLHNLVESMGVDFNSFYQNLANFRYLINSYAIFLSSRLVPKFDYIDRHMWLLQNIWMDSNTAKAQMYNFVVDGVYIYTEVTEGPAYCDFQALPKTTNNKFGLVDFQNITNEIMNSLIASTDIDQMSADIGKAFENDVAILSLIPEDYITPIGFSDEVLSQIENIVLMGPVYENNTNINANITQEVDIAKVNGPRLVQTLFTSPGVTASNLTAVQQYFYQFMNGAIVNMHKQEVSDGEVMVATRGISLVDRVAQVGEGEAAVYITQIGSRGSEVYTYATLSLLKAGNLSSLTYNHTTTVTAADANAALRQVSLWSSFDWAPVMRTMNRNSGEVCRFQDLDMLASIDRNQVVALNTAALLSEFYSDKFIQVIQ